MKKIEFALGDQKYTIPHLTLGQREELVDLWDRPRNDDGFPIDDSGAPLRWSALVKNTLVAAEIMLRHAQPTIANVRDLQCDLDDLRNALDLIQRSGKPAEDETSGKTAAGASPASIRAST